MTSATKLPSCVRGDTAALRILRAGDSDRLFELSCARNGGGVASDPTAGQERAGPPISIGVPEITLRRGRCGVWSGWLSLCRLRAGDTDGLYPAAWGDSPRFCFDVVLANVRVPCCGGTVIYFLGWSFPPSKSYVTLV